MSTFVSIGTGTQSFIRLLDEIAAIADTLPQPVLVQHGSTPFACDKTSNFAFVDREKFETLLAECSLFITHGGGGSVFAALRQGKKPVVVPRLQRFDEIVDDHQLAFVDELLKQDLICPALDISSLASAIAAAIANPNLDRKFEGSKTARTTISNALESLAPNGGKLLLVCPSGGHLAEIRALQSVYSARPHFYVLNVPIIESPDMKGRTQIITLSQRDWKFLINLWEAFTIIRREKPAAILTTGGGFSVAFTLVGKLFNVRTAYVETVAKVNIPTVTGRIMYHLADRFFYQWQQVERYFPEGEYVGLIL